MHSATKGVRNENRYRDTKQSENSPMIETFTDQLIAMARHLSLLERDFVCCGTVTVQQCYILQVLNDSPKSNSDLASISGSSPSAMTRLIDGLIRSGWVERSPDSQDRRKTLVQLTTSGRAEAERLRGLTETAVAEILSRIPEENQQQVMESIALIKTALEKS